MSHGIAAFDALEFFSRRRESVRLLRRGEVIPSTLQAGFDVLEQLDPEWIWVLDCDGVIGGVLVASPCHGCAMIWRISISPEASTLALARLLRAFLRDMRIRGIRGYLTVVSLAVDQSSQSRLARIIQRAGGVIVESGMTLLASPLPKEGI